MDDEIPDSEKVAEVAVTVTLDASLARALDQFIAEKAPEATREQALGMAFAQWAADRGYLPAEQAGTRPEDLNASNDD